MKQIMFIFTIFILFALSGCGAIDYTEESMETGAQQTLDNGATFGVQRTKINENFTEVYSFTATSAGLAGALSDETGTGVSVFGTSPTFATQITLTPEATPTTDADGEIAFDIDGWGTNFDALEIFNGTASAYIVAVTASDSPTNGQVPTWNTGGEITWEDGGGGSGTVTSVTAGNGLDFSEITATGAVTLGTPGTLTSATSNGVTATSHTHDITTGIADTNILRIDGTTNSTEYMRATVNGLEGRTESEFKADFNLEIGTDVQAQNANLDTLATPTNWRIFYSNGSATLIELALGADGTFLKSNGLSAAPTFATPSGSGDVTKVGTPVDSQVGVWTGDGTIEGTSSFTYDGSNLQFTGDLGSTGTRITKGWFTDLEVSSIELTHATENTLTALSGALSIEGEELSQVSWVENTFNGSANIDTLGTVTTGTLSSINISGGTPSTITTWDGSGNLVSNTALGDLNADGTLISTVAIATTGVITAAIETATDADAHTLTSAEYHGGTVLATGAGIYTLPTASAGLSGCVEAGQGITAILQLLPASGDYIVHEGARGTVATAIASDGSAGDRICYRTYNADDWYVSTFGTWAE